MNKQVINIDANFIKEIAKMQERIDETDNAIFNLFMKIQDVNRLDIMYDGENRDLYHRIYMFIEYVLHKFPNIYEEFRENKQHK